MAYLKPPLFVKSVFNKIAMKFGLAGTTTLVVEGRASGQRRRIPVIPVDHAGGRYLVSTRGEADWVRNLRASGKGALRKKGGQLEQFTATEIPVEERAPIISAYRAKAGKTVEAYWKKLPDPADHPTFRIKSST